MSMSSSAAAIPPSLAPARTGSHPSDAGAAGRVDEDLRVDVRAAERAEGFVDTVQADGAGDERLRVEGAVGQHVQGVAELDRAVAEDEAQVDLLVDGHRRAD